MDFDSFIDQAWTEHATDAPAVAARLQAQALALVTEQGRVVPVAHLAHHVFGDHLGRWQEGLDLLARLAALPVAQADATTAVRRFQAALKLAAGLEDGRAHLAAGERIRVTALAAGTLCSQGEARGLALLEEAVNLAEQAGLPDADPAHRSLAAAANNIAATLEEMAQRSETETRTMLRAAQVARRYWALAGTWLETERADYRLALCHLAAGLLPQARQHAQDCLERVQAQGSVPLEAFFGWQALGRVERAAGNALGHGQALAQAEAAFAGLAESDQAWCRASLDTLKEGPQER